MSNQKKAIILLLVLAAVFLAAFFGYRVLSGQYQNSASDLSGITVTEDPAPEASGSEEEALDGDREASASGLDPAADFSMQDDAGERVYLSDHFGRPVLLNFWATWCPPCQQEMPDYDALYAEYGDRVDFLMVNLTDGSRDTVEKARAFVEENGYSFPVYYDTEGAGVRAYGIMSIPTTVCITPDGEIYYMQAGVLTGEDMQGLMERFLNR